jgi:hypothetical protein
VIFLFFDRKSEPNIFKIWTQRSLSHVVSTKSCDLGAKWDMAWDPASLAAGILISSRSTNPNRGRGALDFEIFPGEGLR